MKTPQLSPAKAGEIYGTFKPSLPKGKLNRKERRKLERTPLFKEVSKK